MTLFTAIIFTTGAVTLALELLASRIMTPYFGVSLFIWTGILSITLLSLALGYYLGGRLAVRAAQRPDYTERLRYLFLGMPAVSAISIGAACLVYPATFLHLASFSLVWGSFVACLILLFVPLVTISAMNPLLIALRSSGQGDRGVVGDSGSGLVFFISTVGSVLGVWLTAFLFIPNLANATSVLMLGAMLSSMSLLAGLFAPQFGGGLKKRLVMIAVVGLMICGGILAGRSLLLKNDREIVFNNATWTVEREYLSLYGNIKVLARTRLMPSGAGAPGPYDRQIIYYQDGMVHGVINPQGESQVMYSYALEGLAKAFLSPGNRALVLGLAGGVVPMRLARQGVVVEAVDINPDSVRAAEDFFGYDAAIVKTHRQDARSFINQCTQRYDAIIVDLFTGDGIPDYLLTRNFFADMRQCLQHDGVIVINAFTVPEHFKASYHMFKTLRSVFRHLLVFHDDIQKRDEPMHLFMVATDREAVGNISISVGGVPPGLLKDLQRIFAAPRPLDAAILAQATAVTDELNIFPLLNLDIYMAYRRKLLEIIPPAYLVN
ncbi:MAG: Uncharacterized protein FD165_1394 [Gammaproteobacteria bacterium]|nr:MAG: Uncharacterized protein FD165_1394 [Gammaproteobacteria bacterium]TND04017.1 MAG: Uncharacterized protein FD120_1726 [Gammaproteobacteria bacterium]